MKPKFFFTAITLALSVPAAGLCSEIIRISPSGNDRNGNGTLESPYASLQTALDRSAKLPGNDTIHIKATGGDYFLTEPIRITPRHTKRPLVIEREGSGPAVFYGGIELDRFERYDGKLWRVHIPQAQYGFDFEQLYINGERRFRAQTPDRGSFLSLTEAVETPVDSGWAILRVALDPEAETRLEKTRREQWSDIVFNFYHKWDVTRLRPGHYNTANRSVFFTEQGMKPWNVIDAKTRVVIENYFEALDAPGEWFFDKREGYLYYMPIPGEKPEEVRAIVPVTEKLIVIAGREDRNERVKNIRFRGLSFQVAGYRTPATGNKPVQAAAPIEAAIMADYAENISFECCEIAHTGLSGIWFRRGCSACSIRQCHLHDLGASGLKIGDTAVPEDKTRITNRIVADNNIIQHGGHVFPCAVGVIVFHASDNEITHNDIADFRYSGVSVGWIWGYADSPAKRNRIAWNHIHHLGWGELSDMGGVYTLGRSEGTVVSNNVIHHIYSRYYGGWGLYTDEGSTGVTMSDNLVYACKSAGFHQHYGENNLICNNIFARQLRTQLEATRTEEHLSFTFVRNIVYSDSGELAGINWKGVKAEFDYNCFWDTRSREISFQDIPMKAWKAAGKDVHSIVADPGFVDPDRYDFRIKARSAARKIGFRPFDFSRAGVYGSEEWKQKAQLSPNLEDRFDRLVKETEALGISEW